MYSNSQALSLSTWDAIGAALGRSATSAQIWVRLAALSLSLSILSAVLLQPWVEAKWMFLDPLTAAELSGDCCHTYYGFVSNLGVMAWSATAAVCLFAALVLAAQRRRKALIGFAASAGLLTGWLALDDALLIHEVVFPSFGIPQNAVLVLYLVLGGVYGLASWRTILQSDWLLLFIAGGSLALSMGIDTVFHSLAPTLVYLEDSAKFIGICAWGAFHISTMFAVLNDGNAASGEARL